MESSDEELMAAFRDGDAAAFETLYARTRTRLYRFVLRQVRDRASAEELYQDVWMRVIEARARYVPSARFSTWLYTIAHRRVVDHWRRRGVSLVDAGPDGDPPDVPGDPAAQPEAQLLAREQAARLLAALDELPALQREAFVLRAEAGLSVREIAEATGVSEEAAKSRLRYAVAKLRELIDEH